MIIIPEIHLERQYKIFSLNLMRSYLANKTLDVSPYTGPHSVEMQPTTVHIQQAHCYKYIYINCVLSWLRTETFFVFKHCFVVCVCARAPNIETTLLIYAPDLPISLLPPPVFINYDQLNFVIYETRSIILSLYILLAYLIPTLFLYVDYTI